MGSTPGWQREQVLHARHALTRQLSKRARKYLLTHADMVVCLKVLFLIHRLVLNWKMVPSSLRVLPFGRLSKPPSSDIGYKVCISGFRLSSVFPSLSLSSFSLLVLYCSSIFHRWISFRMPLLNIQLGYMRQSYCGACLSQFHSEWLVFMIQ